MSYIFDLETDFSDEPFTDALGTHIIEFVLGFDVAQGRAIIMSVMLVPGGSFLRPPVKGVYDLRFGLRERDMEHTWKVTPPDYTRDAVEKYIPPECRDEVKIELLKSIKYIVGRIRPDGLTMETFYPNLPDKALGKYAGICELICQSGYEMADQFKDGNNGKNYWFLKQAD